jgi:putative drug exporter of the RND superfamily
VASIPPPTGYAATSNGDDGSHPLKAASLGKLCLRSCIRRVSEERESRVEHPAQAARQALKLTALSDANIELGGTAATFKDIADGAEFDLMIAGVAAMTLIFIIMILVTRALVAACVIVGTIVLSLGAAFGFSTLLWQHILNFQIHWVALVFALIVLLAVGSDYNLMLVPDSRRK